MCRVRWTPLWHVRRDDDRRRSILSELRFSPDALGDGSGEGFVR